MSISLDENDLTILTKLNVDGRATYSDLASELNLTVPTIKSRIQKLINKGIINHIGIYLNPTKLTKDVASLISLQVDAKDLESILEYLKSLDEVREIFETLDTFNLIIITQHQPINMHQLIFTDLKSNPLVKRTQIRILTQQIISKPHRIPMESTFLNIQCDYCGKQISDSYESKKFKDMRRFFCCTSCLRNYEKWWEKQLV